MDVHIPWGKIPFFPVRRNIYYVLEAGLTHACLRYCTITQDGHIYEFSTIIGIETSLILLCYWNIRSSIFERYVGM